MMVVVALIYEITLNFKDELKPRLHAFFEEVVYFHHEEFTREQRDKFKCLDPLRINNFTNFKCDLQSRKILLSWYERSHQHSKSEGVPINVEWIGSFPADYENFLKSITQEVGK